MIDHNNETISVKSQCKLLKISRSTAYYKPIAPETNDVTVMNEIRIIYTECPFYGYRRILVELRSRGFMLNHKRLQRLLRYAGIKAIYPKKNTSVRNSQHKIYPYLLKELQIDRPNQVWAVDITYIKMRRGFVYLVCIIPFKIVKHPKPSKILSTIV